MSTDPCPNDQHIVIKCLAHSFLPGIFSPIFGEILTIRQRGRSDQSATCPMERSPKLRSQDTFSEAIARAINPQHDEWRDSDYDGAF